MSECSSKHLAKGKQWRASNLHSPIGTWRSWAQSTSTSWNRLSVRPWSRRQDLRRWTWGTRTVCFPETALIGRQKHLNAGLMLHFHKSIKKKKKKSKTSELKVIKDCRRNGYTLISFKREGIPAIPKSEAKETKTNTAETLVCKKKKKIKIACLGWEEWEYRMTYCNRRQRVSQARIQCANTKCKNHVEDKSEPIVFPFPRHNQKRSPSQHCNTCRSTSLSLRFKLCALLAKKTKGNSDILNIDVYLFTCLKVQNKNY